jgi:NADPH:quinone reductase-like Zn-dependent oxidoreductase
MKAVLCAKYGGPDVLRVGEVAKPIPRKNEVRIQVNATAVTASDCIARGFKLPRWSPLGIMMGLALGFRRPRNPILGLVLSGEIESTGKAVTSFKAGDKVFAFTGTRCGAYAEYVCLPERPGPLSIVPTLIAPKPTNLNDEQAASIPYGGLLAMCCLDQFKPGRGHNILIYGASGSIGSAAVQLAKNSGATVTAVCSTSNVSLMTALGADDVIDYTRVACVNVSQRYDFILDAVGKKKTSQFKLECSSLLAPSGTYLSVDDVSPKQTVEQLLELKRLAELGVLRPVIDRTYALEQIVEAHRYVDEGHKRGNVIITVGHDRR